MPTDDSQDDITLEQINALRLTRSFVVKLQARYFPHELARMIQGCFVRVLLEASQGDQQAYKMARISGTRSGEEYSGYSFKNESTTTYLDLDVPQAMGHTTNCIALNSISNSDFSHDEYSTWRASVLADPNSKLPTSADLERRWDRLRPYLEESGVDISNVRRDLFKADEGNVTKITLNTHNEKKRRLPHSTSVADDEVAVLKEQIAKLKNFPRDLSNLTMDGLTQLEEELSDYMACVRQKKKDLSCCKICMEKETEVVLLPCKHQVLCQGCSYQVDQCPVCRAVIEDRLTPHKF
eukprot:TRINITY_DN3160_c2_g1_i1.p1 TRINITY_DN3160_c2_g1~~TRINITY_DN3160_c2_g1_i1.p1  ORF type:complete len:295 (+),score=30.62 TRINITY_DN3160_c2_g1_i1:75-959(+)